jgi:hypothetical protein
MRYIIDLIIRAPEARIINYFAEMPKGERNRMFRRMARFVHPDKNQDGRANEAFQKLFSSWRHPLPSLHPSSQLKGGSTQIIINIAVNAFEAVACA